MEFTCKVNELTIATTFWPTPRMDSFTTETVSAAYDAAVSPASVPQVAASKSGTLVMAKFLFLGTRINKLENAVRRIHMLGGALPLPVIMSIIRSSAKPTTTATTTSECAV